MFDLDETLAHCSVQNVHLFDRKIILAFANGMNISVGVNVRPHAISCLTALKKDFELIVFTASHRSYADRVIDILDPTHTLFSHRLFRDSCIQTTNGLYIKDLRIFDRDLSKVILVDNSILSFSFQLDNGVPIIPFIDNRTDSILPKLTEYLLSLSNAEDYRECNLNKFGLRYLYDVNIQNLLKCHVFISRQHFSDKQGEVILSKKRTALTVNEPRILKKVKESD